MTAVIDPLIGHGPNAAVRERLAGGPVVVLDGRGSGHLVAPADDVTTETMAFLVRVGSGFVQVAVTGETCERLLLPPMVWPVPAGPRGDHCVSVDATHGVSTGISAADRALTARLLAAPTTEPDALTRPGHVVPVRVRTADSPAGLALAVAARAGRRAAVLCAAVPAGDPCAEARTEDLLALADAHGLPVVSAADLLTTSEGNL
ncbi:3,4-dihydroxy-2-butanone-4-phosphate synthase [Pseudonocardia sp. RS11V-5]|uniref:3,4-dihydroxy-2-butanone-4-phosphate synthase n=1 Tax=Pseudonocardia terrae TaxID=2905831 RepID=UPI001E578E9E|nr:3,4-dihydroxy-2-butanone-4-phosphate synthase [Pseudonocardia terrae]MCE3551448.1 3,4-dihydroxy-2-butanone-4-phosphate synthase [Pseudonocardia terrae]